MQDDFNWDDRPSKLQYTLVVAVIIILLLAIFAGLDVELIFGNLKFVLSNILFPIASVVIGNTILPKNC